MNRKINFTAANKNAEWRRLENASKIFPATWSAKDSKVFRLACELYEDADADILQKALDIAVDDFPIYRYVLKRGFFWYYLESSDITPVVRQESNTVCAPIYVGNKNTLLFQVTYYKRRINLEIFHALSDGSGAISFFKTLIYHYLTLKHGGIFSDVRLTDDFFSAGAQADDSFDKYFVGGSRKNGENPEPDEKDAYRIRGMSTPDNRLNVIEGVMDVGEVLKEAHNYGATLTSFLTALYIISIGGEMSARQKNRAIVITVPVNLRKYYKSVTARNFFSYISIVYRFGKNPADTGELIKDVNEAFKKKLTVENLGDLSNKYMAMEKNPFARITPLPIKNIVMRAIAYYKKGLTTATVSNIGVITMPEEFNPVIRQFSVCTAGSRPDMTLCSFNGKLAVSISTPFRDVAIQRNFFRLLSGRGIKIEITTNISEEDNRPEG